MAEASDSDNGSLADASRGLGERDGNLPAFTPEPWFWAVDKHDQRTALMRSGTGDYVISPQADVGDYALSVDCWNDVSDADASLIAAAPKLLPLCELLKRSLIYEIRKSLAAGDEEGANLKTYTLFTTMEVLAEAKGLPAPTPDDAFALARGVSQ